ncbi:MAG: molybdopterin-dependent oxidoreductase [Verrucomicrobiae bacterium]|nr:molybdopterin-dependent oxidoreductase [Verrucomicrobiae bacterium]
MKDTPFDPTRRQLLAKGALLGAATAAGPVPVLGAATQHAVLNSARPDAAYELNDPENILYSVCLQCNTGCGIKCKIQNGVVVKIDGNPYNPWTLYPHVPMSASPFEVARLDAGLCPKGQSGVQTAYDPYRIRKVLKRAGKRGENKWITIDFAQAVKEIVEGGKLFAHVPGEENRQVEGLRSVMVLTDDQVAKEMAADVKKIWDKKMTVEEFKQKHAPHLDKLIDPDHPDLGPKNNQLTIMWGRLKGGRSDFLRRFGAGFGTINLHGHTTVCQGSLYFTSKAMSEQYEAGQFTGGQKFYWQTSLENARFVLFVGANLLEANYGPTNRAVRLMENLDRGETRIAVVDPRFSKLASKAWKWLPIKPGTDGALAMAFIRWMLERDRYDKAFLVNANKAAATAAGELSYTNLTWLVKIDPKTGAAGAFVRAADVGLATAEKRVVPDPKDKKKTVEYEEKFMLVMKDGQPVVVDPNDTKTPVTGDLFVDTTLADGTRVKTGMQLVKEAAFEKSFEEWCAICELDPHEAAAVAHELIRHGKRSSVDIHRGVSQHTNGFYNVLGWYTVNAMLGNFDWQGGMSVPSTYSYDGSKGGPFDLTNVPGKITGFGISIIRHEVDYAKTTIFSGYPAKRNWYPLASDVYEEIIPSIGEAYPYPVKALFMYMGSPVYALPAGHTNIEVLRDVNKLPLFFASDILIGTTSMYADYIFPDLSFLERWEFHGSHPNMNLKVQPVRQPVMAPVPETCRVFGQELPISLESLLMAIAEKLGLKAFGANALGEGQPLNRPEDYYLRAVANIAAGSKPADAVPDADSEELALFEKSRRHLPKTVYDLAYWKAAVGDALWPKVVYVLNRGGRFQDPAKMTSGDKLPNPFGKLLCLYQEKTAKYRYAGNGEPYRGYAHYRPIADFTGRPLDHLGKGYDLHLITHRTILQCKTRTITNYWLLPMMPENFISMNPADGARLGLRNGQYVKVLSATNPRGEWELADGWRKPMVGKLRLTETVRPGVVTFELGFGHWATGAADVVIDGQRIRGDARRATGVNANAAMWTDPALRNNTCLLDPVGGSVSFYDSLVRIEPA